MFRSFVLSSIVLLAGLVAVCTKESAAGGDAPARAPVAIPAVVKSDYFLFAHFRAKDVRDSALFAEVKQAFAKAGGTAEWDALWELMGRDLRLGVGPTDIDAVTYCITELPERRRPPTTFIVTSNKAINKAGAFGLKPGAKPDARGFYDLGFDTLVHFPDDKTMAVLHADLAEKYLDGFAKDRAGWPFTAELSKAAAGHTFFAAARPDMIPADERKRRPLREFAPLLAARGVTVTADLKGKELRVAARATFADAVAAGKAKHKAHALIGLVGDGVDSLLTGKPLGDLGAMLPAVKAAERALAEAKVEVVGTDVTASAVYAADFKIEAVVAGFVKYAREELPRIKAQENLSQIGKAVHNYASANEDRLIVHGVGKDGAPLKPTDKPLLSWRVAILPYIEQDNLYKQFKLDEPWDSEHNKKLIDKMPKIYAPVAKPGKAGHTHLQMVIGPAAMRPAKYLIGNIPDGTSNTIAVLEAAEPVIWTKPDDVMFPKEELPKDFRKKFGGQFAGGFHALLWDGSVRFVPDSVSDQTLGYALCPDDGQVLGRDW